MRLGRPVAALDYHNVPRFVPTAWTISARHHIPQVVAELLNPPATKMAFQRDVSPIASATALPPIAWHC